MSEENKPKVAEEVAEADFDRFVESMEIDVDESYMDADDLKSFHATKRIVMRALMRGSLIISSDGEPIYTPRHGKRRDAITFRQPTGAVFMASDDSKRDRNVTKLYAMMGALTGEGAGRFAQMHKPDLDVCTAVGTLFLG